MRNEPIEEEGSFDSGIHDVLRLFRGGKPHLPTCLGTGGGDEHAACHARFHDDGRRTAAFGHHGDRARGRRVCAASEEAHVPLVRDGAARHLISHHWPAVRHAEDGRRLV